MKLGPGTWRIATKEFEGGLMEDRKWSFCLAKGYHRPRAQGFSGSTRPLVLASVETGISPMVASRFQAWLASTSSHGGLEQESHSRTARLPSASSRAHAIFCHDRNDLSMRKRASFGFNTMQ